MREEVALRVAEVRAVEPHVGLVEDAVERDETAAPGRCRLLEVESVAVEQWSVVVGELRRRCANGPGTWTVGHAVVVVEAHTGSAAFVVGRHWPPLSRQIHAGEPRRGSAPGRASSDSPDLVELMVNIALATLGELKASGWQSPPVKEEIRRNAVARDRGRRGPLRRRARLRGHRHAAAGERACWRVTT